MFRLPFASCWTQKTAPATVALALLGLTWSPAATAEDQPGPAIDFTRDVRPILSNHCFTCHGPDAAQRQAGLRLDQRDSALAAADSGQRAIVPHDPEHSELVARITAEDEFVRMPPPEAAKQLTPQKVELLTAWIRQGAPYAAHWSYIPAQRPPLPDLPAAVQAAGVSEPNRLLAWPRNPIDAFLLARMVGEGLTPAPPADRAALIRRVSLDVTGLPPTVEEVDRFVSDPDPEAYEKLVDRLLERPAYGEHWARLWLDLARYADSSGYADDPPRTIWAYRDWVIRALNRNQPFDQFTVEQIAGDLLPQPSDEQLIATAFHRNTLTNNEGGTNDEEFRNVALVDRVNTTMAVWMGTTMACAQCHSHKYDPITQEEYFRMFAIFNNTADADRGDDSPRVQLMSDEQLRQKTGWEDELSQLQQMLATSTPELRASQQRWEEQLAGGVSWQRLEPAAMQSREGAAMKLDTDGSVRVAAGGKTDVYTLEFPLVPDDAPEQRALSAIRLETLPDESLPGRGTGHGGGNFVITRITAALLAGSRADDSEPAANSPPGEAERPANASSEAAAAETARELPLKSAFADYAQAGFDAANILSDDAKSGWAIGGQTNQPHVLTLIPAATPLQGAATLRLTIEQLSPHPRHTLGRFRVSVSRDPQAVELARIPPAITAIVQTAASDRTPAQQDELSRYYRERIAPELDVQRQRLAELQKLLADLKPFTSVPVMQELSPEQARQTFVQHRGNYLDLGEQVEPGLPAAFHSAPSAEAFDRLALARWLVDAENPLTARVTANRYWEAIFGRGIVATSEEFGSQGDLPTHPELLDWLAIELIRLGWDRKALVRLLVTSAAYRQSSQVTPQGLEADPDNHLLARGPRFRLPAETIRDQALFVSGLLSAKMYGPPVRPPQPNLGLSAAFGSGIDWKTSEGEDRHRRGIYTTWRRSSPYPSMITFDAPNREVCTIRRDRTNTPLQALVTLNDPVYVEAAQALARRMVAAGATPAERAEHGFRRCLARPASAAELQQLLELYSRARERFAADSETAARMATEPLGPAAAEADLVELAAWSLVANVLLNLDEVFMKR